MRKEEFPIVDKLVRDRINEVLDKIRAEINKQEKWLLQAGCTAYNVDIAFDAIKAVVAESEDKEYAECIDIFKEWALSRK